MIRRALTVRILPIIAMITLFFLTAQAQTAQTVYTDSLQNGWENWSWSTVNLASTAQARSGTSISSTIGGAWQALYFHHATFSTSASTGVSFWIHGGAAGGQQLQVQAVVGNTGQTAFNVPALTNSWQQVTIPWSSLGIGAGTNIDGFWIQDRTGGAQSVYYVDDVVLTGTSTGPTTAVTVAVDANLNRHAISPLIYGVAFASTAQLLELNAPLNRSGGNATTRYNWQCDCTNRASDWYFESLPESNIPGQSADTFVQQTKNGGAQPMLTIPILDWVAKLGPNGERLASFSISKYGAQTGSDSQWFPDAGNGVRTNGTNVTGNDKNDANMPNSIGLQQSWMQHLIGRWGNSQTTGLKYFFLDNEHSIWFATHRDVQPVGATMEEQFNRMRDYGAMVKAQDPNAIVLGPEEWGWNGYMYSGYDLWYAPDHGYTYPDRAAHGNMEYSAWLLQQFKNYEQTNGRRILDYFTLHSYPQGGEGGNDVSTAMQLKRNRSTRALWDPNYTDESWVNTQIKLIPRMKSWVNTYYPNTKIGITEYNWGAEDHINGATAQADILGIFGREGLDLATRWTTPSTGSVSFKAMKMFRNYDGLGKGFGDISVSASAPTPDDVSAFAAVRSSDNAMTVMVVNKIATGVTTTVNLANFPAGPAAQVWQLTSANQISRVADATVSGGSLNVAVPAQSITLFVIPAATIAAPSGLSVLKVAGSVSLSWTDNTTDEDGFVVERAPATTGVFTEIFRTGANRTTMRSHIRFGTHTYRVRTLRGGVLSDPSNAVQVR